MTDRTLANLALVLWCCLLECTNKRQLIGLCLVQKQQQMQLQVTAEDLLSRLLGELHHHRQTMFHQEGMKRLVGHRIVLQVGSSVIKLQVSMYQQNICN